MNKVQFTVDVDLDGIIEGNGCEEINNGKYCLSQGFANEIKREVKQEIKNIVLKNYKQTMKMDKTFINEVKDEIVEHILANENKMREDIVKAVANKFNVGIQITRK